MRKMSDIVRNQDPVMLPPSATVREACQRMRDRRVGAILVADSDRRLVGISQAVTPSTVCLPREKAPSARSWARS
jgi:predicted transcriptional regulator